MVTGVPTWGHATEIWHREGLCGPHPARDSWSRPWKLPFSNLSPNLLEVLNALANWYCNIWYLLPRLNLLWSIQGTHCSSTWCHGWLMFRYCHGPKFCIIYYVPCFLLWAIPSGRHGSIQMVVATASARKGLEERNATATPKDEDSRMLEPCLMEIMMPSRFQHCSP